MKNLISSVLLKIKTPFFAGSKDYWEKRYAQGGNSGAGSFGKLAQFKAEVINEFVRTRRIESVVDFGCGDGNQLKLLKFAPEVKYSGLDVSPSALEQASALFREDSSKTFKLYAQDSFKSEEVSSELALSLDVLYHLVEDKIFEKYMRDLFVSATKFVMIYSSDFDEEQKYHQRNRNFTKWVSENINDWELIKIIKNPYSKESKEVIKGSPFNFYVFKKKLLTL